MVVDDVENLHVGAVGKLPVGGVCLPQLVGLQERQRQSARERCDARSMSGRRVHVGAAAGDRRKRPHSAVAMALLPYAALSTAILALVVVLSALHSLGVV
jgi:hypothetical protein